MASLSAIISRTSTSWQILIALTTLLNFHISAVPVKTDSKNKVQQLRIKRNPSGELIYYSTVCDGSTMDLRCPNGYVLMVEQANYGRTDRKTCVYSGTPETNDQCFWMPYSYDVVSQRCDQRNSCRIDATIYEFRGDPCPGVSKYLEVQFECIPRLRITTPGPLPTDELATDRLSTTQRYHQPGHIKTKTTVFPLGETTIVYDDDDDDDQLSTDVPTSKMMSTKKTPTTTNRKVVTIPVTGQIKIDFCPEVVQRGVTWEETTFGNIVSAACPEGTTGSAKWACVGHPSRWFPESGPDLSNCVSPWVNNITKMIESGKSSNDVTAALAEATNQEDELYGGDVLEVVNILSTSLEKTKIEIAEYQTVEEKTAYTTQVTENFILTGSNMLADNRKSSWQDLPKREQADTATNLLASIEKSAFLMADTFEEERSFYGETENVLMEVMVHKMKKATYDLQFPNTPSFAKTWNNIQDRITISSASIEDKQQEGKVKLVFFAYNNMEELLGVTKKSKDTLVSKKFVNSRIISLSVNNPMKPAPLKEPVKMIFNHLMANGTSDPTCSFWKFANSTHGEWSSEGCHVVDSNSTHTECSCDHLTNFAIIMDIKGVKISETHTFALSTITYAGFTISITCLLMAFITFTAFKNLQNDRNTIHKNLCLCLLVAEFVFLVGIDRDDSPIMCTVVAVLLHYFFLASFAWMCLEGIQLYVMLVEVFEAESSRRKYYYPFGYGVPLITVAIAALANYEGYGTESHCWLEVENHFIWSFIGPVCIVIMVNTVFLTMAFVIMCRHSTIATNKRQKTTKEKLTVGSDKLDYIMSWVRGSFVLLCILGITWIFGLLYVSDSTVIFAYIFTVFNSVQGVFIFVFHCLMNDKVKKEYRRFVRKNSWIPMCLRVQFGGVSSSQSNQQASYRSSSTSAKLRNMWDNRRYSDSTSMDKRKSSTSLNKGSVGEAQNRFSMSVESPSSESPMIREGNEYMSDVFITEPHEDPAPLALDENSVIDDSIADHLGWRIRENPLSLPHVKEEDIEQKSSYDSANILTEMTHLEDDSKEEQNEHKPLINVYVNGLADAQDKNNEIIPDSETNKNKVNEHCNEGENDMFSTPNVYVITEDTDELEEKDTTQFARIVVCKV